MLVTGILLAQRGGKAGGYTGWFGAIFRRFGFGFGFVRLHSVVREFLARSFFHYRVVVVLFADLRQWFRSTLREQLFRLFGWILLLDESGNKFFVLAFVGCGGRLMRDKFGFGFLLVRFGVNTIAFDFFGFVVHGRFNSLGQIFFLIAGDDRDGFRNVLRQRFARKHHHVRW